MSRKPRYNAIAAADRTRLGENVTKIHSAAKSFANGTYKEISVKRIVPAPWQPRRVFEHLEELAVTIEGTGETNGVGVLEPVLVRPLANGDYECIDGERRLRACLLLAERSPSHDYVLPALVFVVSEHVARLMGHTANAEREEPRPFEVALGYQGIRDAVFESGDLRGATARSLAGIGWHAKTQVSDYLRIADMLTPDVLTAAGLVSDAGEPDFALLCRLEKSALDKVVKFQDPGECAAALRARVDRLRNNAPPVRKQVAARPIAASADERRAQIAVEEGFAIKVRAPAQMIDPTDVRLIIEQEMLPAMLAFVERAFGGHGGDGFLSEIGATHAVLVLPGRVEALPLPRLEQLSTQLDALRRRVGKAVRAGRRNSLTENAA